MRRTAIACFTLTVAVLAPRIARAQATPPAAAQTPAAAPTTVHGSFDVGYRFTDVTGNENTFKEMFNLDDGLRLFGVDLRGTSSGEGGMPQTFTFNASGVGGDPFPTLDFRARSSRKYDVRGSWRRLDFFSVAPLTPASIDGFDTQAVTDHHSWATDRTLGNISATITPTDRLQLLFTYDRVSRDGGIGSTRTVDFVGSPSSWGSYARANPYPVTGAVDDSSDRFIGGVSYGRDLWTVHYRAGYQSADESIGLDPIAGTTRSINVGDATTVNEPLTAMNWAQTRSLSTPMSELSLVVGGRSRLEWRTEYLYYRPHGPFALDAGFTGTARTVSNGSATSPYNVVIAADGDATASNNIFGQGLTYRHNRYWGADFDYRYSHYDSESTGDLTSVLSNYTAATSNPQTTIEHDVTNWTQSLQTFRITGLFQLTPSLTIRPGVFFEDRNIEMLDDGVINAASSHDDSTVQPELSIAYRPRRWLSARATWRNASNDTPYTRMSPADRTDTHLIATVQPMEALTLTASGDFLDAKQTATGFENRIRGGSIHASYTFNDRLTGFGSYDYRSLLATGTVTFARGTGPLEDLPMQDDELNHIWQGGVTARLTQRLEVTATGNYDRTTGLDMISGEPPLYGPDSFAYGTISGSYDVPVVGRVSVDWQRAHYFQEILPMNDFRSTMVIIRLTRGF